MDKFWDILKKKWFVFAVVAIIVLFAVAIVPLLINRAFSRPARCEFLAVDCEAKDALAYYGSALGFIGTAVFSGLALWQNHIIKTQSDNRELQKHLPVFSVRPYSCSGDGMNVSFGIKNLSDNAALDVVVSKIQILNSDGSEFWINEREHRYANIGMDAVTINLNNPSFTSLDQVCIWFWI